MIFPVGREGLSLSAALLAIILLVLVPTLSVVAFTLAHVGRSQRDISVQQLLESAHIVAQSTVSEVQVTERLLKVISGAGQPGINVSGLAAVAQRMGGAHAIYDVRRNGDILNPEVARMDPEVASAVSLAARDGDVHLTNFLAPMSGGLPQQIALAIPLGRQDGEQRVAVIRAPSNRLIRALRRDTAETGAVVLAITDGAGRIIGRSVDGEANIGRTVPDWARLEAQGGDSGWFRAERLEGSGIVFAFQRIPGTPGWVAVAGEPVESFDARWRGPTMAMFLAAAVAIAAALGLALLLARALLRTIRALALRSYRIAHNVDDTTARVPVTRSVVREFETLRVSLDAAEEALRRSLGESRAAEAALRESYEIQMQAERIARIGSWSLDLRTQEFTSSPMLYELNGVSPGTPIRLGDLRGMVDEASMSRIELAIECCARRGTPYGMEILHRRADGRNFPAWLQGRAMRDEEGRVIRIIGIVQDISERKEQAELLVMLADNLPSGVIFRLDCVPGRLPQLTYVSAGIERLTGITPERAVGDPAMLLRAIDPADRRGLLRALRRDHAIGDVIEREFRLHTVTGAKIWVQARAGLRRSAGAEPVWDGIAVDITAEKDATQAMRAARDAAEAAERTKAGFIATMSHELRTPLNTLIGMSRLTLRSDLSARQRDYLEKIHTSAMLLLELINDILDFSKIEAGGIEIEREVFPIEDMLDKVSAVNALRAEEKGLELTFSIASDTPQMVRGDALRLGQVLTNLVGNAIKFTERGDVVVTVRPLPAGHGTRLLFEVRDTGIGLTPEQIKGLFRPFAQGSSDIARRYGGTGLGLATCRQLVGLMGGDIWVESVPGQGSSFFFTVALETVAETEAPAGRALPAGGLRRRRVLVVDDNASARIALSEMLESFGMTVATAADGPTALRLLRQEGLAGSAFDLVLTDWRMPGMDGIDLMRQIAAARDLPKMPAVLMVTAYDAPGKLCEQVGLCALLQKPVTPSVLYNTISGVLGAQVEPESPPPEVAAILTGRRILVADDNLLNREVATDFLRLAGAEVETAVDGHDAIQRLGEGRFDAVLMDIHMPKMNGLDAVREIRRNPDWAGIPVIALTAQARDEDAAASRAAGMTGHLIKPIDEGELYRTLLEAFGEPVREAAFIADADALRRRFGDRPERLRRFVTGFLRDFGATGAEALRLGSAGDLAALAELAHRVKGTAGYVGADALVEQARRLEQAARARDGAAAGEIVPVFARLAEECVTALRQMTPEIAAPQGVPLSQAEARETLETVTAQVALGEYAALAGLERLASGLSGAAAEQGARALAAFEAADYAACRAALAELGAGLSEGSGVG